MSRRSRSTSWSFNGAVIGICVAGVALVVGSIIGRSSLFAAPYNAQTSQKYKNKLASIQKELVKLEKAKTPDTKKIKSQTDLANKLVSDSHWHAAYGIYNCNAYVGAVVDNADGTKTQKGSIDATNFPDTAGIHAHDDGLIHIHPFLDRVSGKKARMGVFFDAVQMTMSDKKIAFPSDATGVKKTTLDVEKTKCKGKTAEISILLWSSAKDTQPQRYTGDFRKVPLKESAAYAFVFAPKGTVVPIPPSIAAVAAPADTKSSDTSPTTTIPGQTSSTLVTTGSTPVSVVVGASTTIAGSVTTIAGSVTTVAGSVTTVVGSTTTSPRSVTTVPRSATTTATPTTSASNTSAG